MSDTRAAQDDDVYLRQFGIEPKLKRAIGFLSSSLFAIAFQGPTTGALLITGATLAFGGPAFIWAIPLIFIFQMLVALTWAELSSHYPLTGGIYQWAKYLGGEGIGWATGLFYLVAILLVMPAVGLVINIVLAGVIPDLIKFNATTEIVISFLTIIATALILSTSVRIVALINNIGVTLELIVLLGAAVLLLGHVHQPLSVLFTTGGAEGKDSYIVPFLIVIALVITQFVGFETAGTFAEETKNSRVSPARAIMTALAGACLFVFIFDFALILSLPDVAKGMKDPEGVIPATLTANLGSFGAKAFLVAAFIAVSSTSIAPASCVALSHPARGQRRTGDLHHRRSAVEHGPVAVRPADPGSDRRDHLHDPDPLLPRPGRSDQEATERLADRERAIQAWGVGNAAVDRRDHLGRLRRGGRSLAEGSDQSQPGSIPYPRGGFRSDCGPRRPVVVPRATRAGDAAGRARRGGRGRSNARSNALSVSGRP
jgi:hypothetical protein